MRLTNGQFVDKLLSLSIPSNDIIHQLEVSMKLLKKYGRMLFTDKYIKEIHSKYSDIADLLQSLKIAKKHDMKTIKILIRLIKEKATDYYEEFIVKAWTEEHYMQMKAFLDKKFDKSSVENHTTMWNSVRVSWEGRYYKRGLEQDAKKLLDII